MIRRSYVFSGRVQGVGFRMTALSVADRFAVTGWVRNEPDGSVRLEAQGTADEIERFIEALRHAMSVNIKHVTVADVAMLNEREHEFVIAR